MSVETTLRSYILENFLFTDDGNALNNEDSFLEKGFIDSTGILEVITFVEDEFDIQIADEEMIPENLDSIDNLLAFIDRKKTSA